MLELKWIESIVEFNKLKDDWDSSLEACKSDNPFLLSDFIITWWEIFGGNNKMKIFVLYDHNEIVAGFPLYIKKFSIKKGFLSCLCQIGDSYANINEPFYKISIDIFTAFFIQALNQIEGWDYAHLFHIKNKFVNLAFDHKAKFNFIEAIHEYNPIIEIKEDVDSIVKKYGKKLRRNISYYRKKLEQNGYIELIELNDLSKIEELCFQYIQFSKESRKERGVVSSYEDDKYEKCTTELIMRFAAKGRIFAHVLKNASESIGIAFGYKYGTGYKWIFTSYNPKYKYASPGYTLIYELINYVYLKRLNYIDLYSGGEVFYKKQWANKNLSLTDIKIFNNTPIGIIIAFIYKIKILIRNISSIKKIK